MTLTWSKSSRNLSKHNNDWVIHCIPSCILIITFSTQLQSSLFLSYRKKDNISYSFCMSFSFASNLTKSVLKVDLLCRFHLYGGFLYWQSCSSVEPIDEHGPSTLLVGRRLTTCRQGLSLVELNFPAETISFPPTLGWVCWHGLCYNLTKMLIIFYLNRRLNWSCVLGKKIQ